MSRATDPIRVFVGIDSADSPTQRAALAVQELERFGGFNRAVIAVGTSAGAGTVDPGEVTPLEYLLSGDVATVSTSTRSFRVSCRSPSTGPPGQRKPRRSSTPCGSASTDPCAAPATTGGLRESLGAYGASGAFQVSMICSHAPTAPCSRAAERHCPCGGDTPRTRAWHAGICRCTTGTHLRWANQPADLSLPTAPFRSPRVGVSAERLRPRGVVVTVGALVTPGLAGRAAGPRRPVLAVAAAGHLRGPHRGHDEQPGCARRTRSRLQGPIRWRPGPTSCALLGGQPADTTRLEQHLAG